MRFPDDWLARIDAAAAKLGTNRARLISFCAQTFTDKFEEMGEAMMPPDWKEIFESMDGRRKVSYGQHKPNAAVLHESNSKPDAAAAKLLKKAGASARRPPAK